MTNQSDFLQHSVRPMITKLTESPLKKYYIFIVIGLTFLVYSPLIQNELIEYDLSLFLMGYKYLELNLDNLKQVVLYEAHPFTHITHMVLYDVVGEAPFPHLFANLLLHIFNIWLVYQFIYNLFLFRLDQKKTFWLALGIATAFAFNPNNVETVAWVMCRKDVLYSFFYLSGLILYLKYANTKNYLWYAFTFVLFYFALESKAMAIPFSLSLISIDYYLYHKSFKFSRLILEKIPFLFMSFYWGGGFYMLSQAVNTGSKLSDGGQMTMGIISKFPFIERLVYACAGVIKYIYHLVLPHELALIYPYPVPLGVEMPSEYWFFTIPILVLIVIFIYAIIKKIRFLVFGISFFIFNIFLTLHLVIPVTFSIVNDRYTYMASLGLYVILAYGFMLLIDKKQEFLPKIVIGLSVYFLFFAIFSFFQVQVWQNNKTVWSNNVKYYPKAAQGWFGLGNHENQNKNHLRAIDFYDKAIECLPYFAEAYYNRANSLFEVKEYQKALESYNQAIKRNYINPSFYYNRGNTFFKLKKYNEAIEDYDILLSKGDNSQGYYNRGMSYINLKQKELACQDFENASELGYQAGKQAINSFCKGIKTKNKPTKSVEKYITFYNQANTFFNQKNYQKALQFYSNSIQEKPISGAHFNRGNTYYQLGKYQKATQDYSKALELRPSYAEAYFNRGMANVSLNQKDKACPDFEKANELNYKPAEAQLKEHCE